MTLSKGLRRYARFSRNITCKGPVVGHTRLSEDDSKPEGPEHSEPTGEVVEEEVCPRGGRARAVGGLLFSDRKESAARAGHGMM